MDILPFRQIHLDFHTSELLAVGEEFDAIKYKKILEQAHVESVTTFAVCHHGWSYNNTNVGVRHPRLKYDLLRQQYSACKEIGIKVPIYISAGFNYRLSMEHPEWNEITYDGISYKPGKAGFIKLCFNTSYLDHLCQLIKEIVIDFPDCDGIFLDIVYQGECCCPECVRKMSIMGLDVRKENERRLFSQQVLENYYRQTTQAARANNPDMRIFHNSGHIQIGSEDMLKKYFSHLELESLPTGGWGYDHFPISAAYARNLPFEFSGMTGKFHTSWGEFGGFKHPNALRYECAAMLAYGARCSIGDQLHPTGKLDTETYHNIGIAFLEVKQKEEWCINAQSAATLAILSGVKSEQDRNLIGDTGAARVLLEGHLPFDVIDYNMDFDRYKVLLLPDTVIVSSSVSEKLKSFLKRGGKLILSGNSGTDTTGKFLLDMPFEDYQISSFSPEFVLGDKKFSPDFCHSPFVIYLPGRQIIPHGNVHSIGDVYRPYFNRSYKHFCSHQHTPWNSEKSQFAAGVITENILYFAHPIFSVYGGMGAVAVKDFIIKSIKAFMSEDVQLKTSLPSTARISLMEQKEQHRKILHLLYANKISRGGLSLPRVDETQWYSNGATVEVIEDMIPLYNVDIELKCSGSPKMVNLVPQKHSIPFQHTKNGIKFQVPKLDCHQMCEIIY